MKNLLNIRRIAAMAIAIFLGFVGVRFYYFVKFYESMGQGMPVSRPPSVEGFLPVSALMSFRNFLQTGLWDNIHPAGLTIFIAVLLTAFLFRRFFCSFICPIGTMSDWLYILGQKIFKQSFQPPKWLNYILGSLKYLLLAFFIFITSSMSIEDVSAFIQGDYNKIADVKMLYFFLGISGTGLAIILILAVASVFIPYFWCRYLCPYGALLAIVGKFSPTMVKRNTETCIDCKKCDQSCPMVLDISTKKTVTSLDCISCMACVDSCPKADALSMSFGGKNIDSPTFAGLALGIFFAIIVIAMVSGYWQTSVTHQDWQRIIPYAKMLNH